MILSGAPGRVFLSLCLHLPAARCDHGHSPGEHWNARLKAFNIKLILMRAPFCIPPACGQGWESERSEGQEDSQRTVISGDGQRGP